MSYFLDTSKFTSVDQGSEVDQVQRLDQLSELDSVGNHALFNSVISGVFAKVRDSFRKYDVMCFKSGEKKPVSGDEPVSQDGSAPQDNAVLDDDVVGIVDEDDAIVEFVNIDDLQILNVIDANGEMLPYTGIKEGEIVTMDGKTSKTYSVTSGRGAKAIKIDNLIGEEGGQAIQFEKRCNHGKRFEYVVDMMTFVVKDFLAKNTYESGDLLSFDLSKYGVGGYDDEEAEDSYGGKQMVHSVERIQFLDDLIQVLELNLNDDFYLSGDGEFLFAVSINGNTLVVDVLEPTNGDVLKIAGIDTEKDFEAMRMIKTVTILNREEQGGVSF